MLTRLEASGFKNLVDFRLEFGPYTCIAGPNGVGKSNVFDAIRFLSLLAEHTINDAARRIRVAPPNENTGDLSGIFFGQEADTGTAPGQARRFKLAAEMIVPPEVSDDVGRLAPATSSFLRYEVGFRYEEPSLAAGPFGRLVLEQEALRPLTVGQAHRHLRFPHSKAHFRNRVVYGDAQLANARAGTDRDAPPRRLHAAAGHRFRRGAHTGHLAACRRGDARHDASAGAGFHRKPAA